MPEATPVMATASDPFISTRPLHVGVVGATGNVGTIMLRVLEERGVPIASLRAFASSRSAGTTVRCGSFTAVVEDLADSDPAGLDVALFSAGADRARDHAPRFAAAGCIVIDNSSAFRMDEGIPLVVPEVNASDALQHQGIIANPNCSTIQLVAALKPLQDAFGLEHVIVTTFQSVSGTGQAAMEELHVQAADVIEARPVAPSVYPHQIAFNVLPHCDTFDDAGVTKEERKLMDESRKILHAPQLRVGATCVRVPVYVGHAESVHMQLSTQVSAADVRQVLADAPGVVVCDDPGQGVYPMPITAAGRDEVFVGRIRQDSSTDRGCAMFVVADNLRKGAATNAVQILEVLAANGTWDETGPPAR